MSLVVVAVAPHALTFDLVHQIGWNLFPQQYSKLPIRMQNLFDPVNLDSYTWWLLEDC